MLGLLGGLAGTLLSTCLDATPHVNGSALPATYIGMLFGYTVMRWSSWDYAGSGRWQMLLIQGTALGILFWECRVWPLTDQAALMGSFFVGFLLAWSQIGALLKKYVIA